jgi:hypothetical protein
VRAARAYRCYVTRSAGRGLSGRCGAPTAPADAAPRVEATRDASRKTRPEAVRAVAAMYAFSGEARGMQFRGL